MPPPIETVQRFLQNQAAENLDLSGFRLIWTKAYPDKGLRLLYTTKSDSVSARPYFFARTMSPQEGQNTVDQMNRYFGPHIARNGFLRRMGKAALYFSAHNLLIQIFPADRFLPFLVQAMDPDFMRPAFGAFIRAKGHPREVVGVQPFVVRYKPERKCLIQYRLHWPEADSSHTTQVVYAKIFRKMPQVYDKLQRIYRAANGSGFQIPEPLGKIPELCLQLTGNLPGTHLSLLAHRDDFPAICAQVGKDLLEFHRTPVLLADRHDVRSQLEGLQRWGTLLAEALRAHAPRIHRLIEVLSRRMTGLVSPPAALVHGDFHVANILVDGARLGLLDLEDCGMGNPAIDVGSFHAQLKLLSLKLHADHTALDASIEAFLQAYLQGCSPSVATSIPTYSALSALWCAYFQCVLRPVKKGWYQRALTMIE
ncbi:MAG: aminoglycoside phosphotransferase family protein, partial [Calditrichaeota bacterium]